MPDSYHAPLESVTIRPPDIYTDDDQMRDILIATKYDALPGYPEHNEARIIEWQKSGSGVFRALIKATQQDPIRHFVSVAADGPRVVGYIVGSVTDTEQVVPLWHSWYAPIVGCGSFPLETRPLEKPYNSCDGLMVDPDYQDRGVGRHLIVSLFALMSRVEPAKFYPFRLQVAETNQRALQFYHGLGFEQIGRCEPTVDMPATLLNMQLDKRSHLGGNVLERARYYNCYGYTDRYLVRLRSPNFDMTA